MGAKHIMEFFLFARKQKVLVSERGCLILEEMTLPTFEKYVFSSSQVLASLVARF